MATAAGVLCTVESSTSLTAHVLLAAMTPPTGTKPVMIPPSHKPSTTAAVRVSQPTIEDPFEDGLAPLVLGEMLFPPPLAASRCDGQHLVSISEIDVASLSLGSQCRQSGSLQPLVPQGNMSSSGMESVREQEMEPAREQRQEL